MSASIKRHAAPFAGYAYQNLIGIRLLLEWLKHPSRYVAVIFECDKDAVAPQGLDDIVAFRPDNSVELTQVKFTVDPDNDKYALSWDWLLKRERGKEKARPLLKKWYDAMQKIPRGKVADACLVTNRLPDRDFWESLDGDKISWGRLSPSVQSRIGKLLGGAPVAQDFFSRFRFLHSDGSYRSLEAALAAECRSAACGEYGFLNLRAVSIKWATHTNEPAPDGRITLSHLRSVIAEQLPVPLDEEFEVPVGYCPPDLQFHRRFLADLKAVTRNIVTVSGPPGRGKSTYISYVCRELIKSNIPFVRHHYFLRLGDREVNRFSLYRVGHTLLSQIQAWHPKAVAGAKYRPEELHAALEKCGAHYRLKKKPFVVFIDGLDHVWRENANDVQPLEELMAQLIPVPENVIVVLGTQGVEDRQLSRRLLRACPRRDWLELPSMDLESILAKLNAVLDTGALFLHDRIHDVEAHVKRMAVALSKVTKGHPLHLVYSLEALRNRAEPLTDYGIEQLEPCPDNDIRSYYGNLWKSLNFLQQDMLFLVAGFDFLWPEDALVSIFTDEYRGHEEFQGIRHLLSITSVGVKPFHGSLLVFLRRKPVFKGRLNKLTPKVLTWLEKDAPETLRWGWLWIAKATVGDFAPLLSSPSREWARESLANGRPLAQVERIFAEAERVARAEKRFIRLAELRWLKHRVAGGAEYQVEDGPRWLLSSALQLDSAREVYLNSVASIANLTDGEVLAVCRSAIRHSELVDAKTCSDELLRRYQRLHFTADVGWSERAGATTHLVRAIGLCDPDIGYLKKISGTKGPLGSEPREVIRALCSEIAARDPTVLIEAGAFTVDPRLRFEFQLWATRGCVFNGVAIHGWPQFPQYSDHPFPACWGALIGTPTQYAGASRFNPKQFDKKYLEHDEAEFEAFVHELFFQILWTGLRAEGAFSPALLPQFENKPLTTEVIRHLATAAVLAARRLKAGTPVGYAFVYEHLEGRVTPPTDPHELWYEAPLLRALMFIAQDLELLCAALGLQPELGIIQYRRIASSPLFKEGVWRGMYIDRKLLPIANNDAVLEHSRRATNRLANSVTMLQERTTEYFELTELALINNLTLEGRGYLKLAIEAMTSYGWKKDYGILDALEALVMCARKDAARTMPLVTRIAPVAEQIGDFTDGDENAACAYYLGLLLTLCDDNKFADYYRELLRHGEGYYADKALSAYVEEAPLDSPAIRGLVLAAHGDDTFSSLKKRAGAGDGDATSLLEDVCRARGTSLKLLIERHADSATISSEFKGDPGRYPPKRFTALQKAIKEAGTYNEYRYLPRWYEYWKGKGKEIDLLRALLHRFEEDPHKQHELDYLLDPIFRTVLKLKGKSAAYKWAVAAHIRMGGWDRFASLGGWEERLQLVAKSFAHKANEFIEHTLASRYARTPDNESIVVPFDKLVAFFLMLRRDGEAFQLTELFVRLVEEDVASLPLTPSKLAFPTP